MKGVYAIIPAAGSSKRLGLGYNKMLLEIGSNTVIEHTLSAFKRADRFNGVIIACRPEEMDTIARLAKGFFDNTIIVKGGRERQDSVYAAVKLLPRDAYVVAVHDGARCMVSPELIRDCVDSARKYGSGVAGRHAVDTVKECKNGEFVSTIDRQKVVLAETPQAFRADILRRAYDKAYEDGFYGTDDASLAERLGYRPRLVVSRCRNDKITHKSDIRLGEFMLSRRSFKVGQGQDYHRLTEGRRLILGGVDIPFEKGLLGHSDADVLTHAVMDALLGAAGLLDIGNIFPDNDDTYKDADSLCLLAQVGEKIRSLGFSIENIDATVVLERPKIAPYRAEMADNIGGALGIGGSRVSIKATTTEGMGPEGRGEGASAQAVCLLSRQN